MCAVEVRRLLIDGYSVVFFTNVSHAGKTLAGALAGSGTPLRSMLAIFYFFVRSSASAVGGDCRSRDTRPPSLNGV